MNSALLVLLIGVSAAMAENCITERDCSLENCPPNAGYVVRCSSSICTCEHAGECQTSNDCQNRHGKCENNDKHWYCNGYHCCCGEPCPHAGDRYVCHDEWDCQNQFWDCTNNDKSWYCTDSHCHCGSPHGSIHS